MRYELHRLYNNKYTRPLKQLVVRRLMQNGITRSFLNDYYRSLNPLQAANFYHCYAKIFRSFRSKSLEDGEWIVDFAGKAIKLPLRAEEMWLDWDLATSIVAHDIEVKQTYSALLSSENPPELFLDIGANYGTHSVLFLSQNIPTVSFEPNPDCLAYHLTVCRLNGLQPKWEQLALGEREGFAELKFPESDTWNGTISSEVIEEMQSRDALQSINTKVVTLDSYMEKAKTLADKKNVLIKIDVEGSEIDVLFGAKNFIFHRRPKIIFESNNPSARGMLIKCFEELGYGILLLPFNTLNGNGAPLSSDAFICNPMTNFIALSNSEATN